MSTATNVQSLGTHILLERGAVTALYQEKREHCQHGQEWVSSVNTAQVKLHQRKRKAAISRGLPCRTPLALYHQPRELRTAPLNEHHHRSTKSLQAGDLVSSFGMPGRKYAIVPILFSSFLFSQSCWAQVLLLVTFLKGCVWPFF